MPATSMPDDEPLKQGGLPSDDEAQGHEDSIASDFSSEEEEGDVEVDFKDVVRSLDEITDEVLIARNIISAERGYTIEQLKNGDDTAWAKFCKRFLEIAVYLYGGIVQFYLPGVDVEDAKSAVGEIVFDLCEKIADYPSLPQLEAAFRTALRRDIYSLQRKFLAKKRGEGKIDVTSKLHGLGQIDALADRISISGDDDTSSTSSLEVKVNKDYGNWGAHKNDDAHIAANRRDQKVLMAEAMSELKPDERQLLEWSELKNLSQPEIAKKLGKGTSSIGVRIARAKAKLRKRVGEKLLIERKTLL